MRGDARHLDVPSRSADVVLLLGPLYHLVEHSDRLAVLREVHRILTPRGVLFAAAISRFASLIDGLASGFFRDAEFRKIVAEDIASGQHRNPTNHPAYFTTATFIARKTWQPKFMLAVLAMSRSLRSRVRFGVPLCSMRLGTTRYSERA